MLSETHSSDSLGKDLPAGSRHYRAFVGPPEGYDLVSAMQFNLLTALGLREHHTLLDIGCGSLRSGRLFITFLLPGNYCGIEPEKWLVEDGIANEIGNELIKLKNPIFEFNSNFNLEAFGRTFDFLVAQSIFSHATVSQISQCLRQARRVMTTDSIFAATFVEGGTNYGGDEWVYPGCVTYTWDTFKHIVEDHGLRCQKIEWSHPGWQTWVAITDPSNDTVPYLMDPAKASRVLTHPYVKLGLTMRSLFTRGFSRLWR